MEYYVGIDLGTTYSCLAFLDEDGNPVVEKNFEQEDTTPSVILFNENGEIIVGSSAKEMSVMYPAERTITAIKRHMGTEYDVEIDGNSFNPITLSATILKKMINDFNDNHGCTLKNAVITCPAYFGQAERDATKAAGQVVGLDEVVIINEPTAAAISFGFGAQEEKKRILVYDLGGGTFDVTILEIDGPSFVAVSTDGERLLGGKDWDLAITKLILNKVSEDSGIDVEDLMEDEDVKQSLVLDSETIKKRLSTMESTKNTLTADGTKYVYTVTREEFETATAPLIETTLEIIQRALDAKDFSMGDIDDVVLVGGSSKMPQVKAGILSRFPDANVKLFDPDQSVAKGASIFGYSYDWSNVERAEGADMPVVPGISVSNVLSKSFGIKATYEDGEEIISNIIFRNEKLPIEAVKTYYPMDSSQSSIKVEIYEDAAENISGGNHTALIDGTLVGDFEMNLPSDITSDTPIEVHFTASSEGILTATVLCMDEKTDYRLQNKIVMSDDEISEGQGLMEKVTNAM